MRIKAFFLSEALLLFPSPSGRGDQKATAKSTFHEFTETSS